MAEEEEEEEESRRDFRVLRSCSPRDCLSSESSSLLFCGQSDDDAGHGVRGRLEEEPKEEEEEASTKPHAHTRYACAGFVDLRGSRARVVCRQ